MSTLNMTKNTSSKIKDACLTLVFIGSLLGVTLSTCVNAAPVTNIENVVSKLVVAQGNNMVTELNEQLQQSIQREINALSSNLSLNSTSVWFNTEQQVQKDTPKESGTDNKVNTSTHTNKNQTK